MRKRIPLDQVKVGMRIKRLDKAWLSTPFLFHSMRVTKARQIERLRAWGVRFVDIETPSAETLPVPEAKPVDAPDDGSSVQGAGRLSPARPGEEPTVPFEEELPAARQAFLEAKSIVQHAMEDVRIGRTLNIEPAVDGVDALADSILRNPHTLTSLTRLKRFDHYTFYHSVNTCILALAVGTRHGLDRESLTHLGTGVLLHDIGKMTLPPEILNKRGPYHPHEFDIMKLHTIRGAALLDAAGGLHPDSLRPALEHHERSDGTGYPFRRTKQELTVFGMIAGVVDMYDALTSDRGYHEAMPPFQALQLLYHQAQRGQLDLAVVERLIQSVGIYPVGSCVALNTGEIGIVKEPYRDQLLTPILLIVKDTESRQVASPCVLELAGTAKPTRRISEVLNAGSVGIDANAFLDAG